MNILIPHSWLLEHLDTAATPAQIAQNISLCGPSVERVSEVEDDSVYDIEVTTNRVDSMSVRGIAREVAVILPQFGIEAQLKPQHLSRYQDLAQAETQLPLPTIHLNQYLVKRVTCVVLANVQRTQTPDWMARRLRQVGMNIHDSVIDITNYITHELGHPCHAFDYDRLMALGGEIIIKEAGAGQTFMTLDGVEFTTVGGEVVFENQAGEIIDLPSIKGTANTSINAETKNVLLFSENTVAEKVRFASMTHAIRTVAAQLEEKNVDPELATDILQRGTELYVHLCGAQIASPVYDEFPVRREPQQIQLSVDTVAAYLGLELPRAIISTFLENIGCEVELHEEMLLVTPPSFRRDLELPVDLIEEIARLYGYHNLPSVLMPTAIPLTPQPDVNFSLEQSLKSFLAHIGWQEVYCYSMVSAEIATQSGFKLEEHLKITNPLADDRVYLRRSLLPSLIEVLGQNPQVSPLSIFEMATVYLPQPTSIPVHELHLSGVVTGRSYRQLRGELEALLQQLFITDFDIEPVEQPLVNYLQSAQILARKGEELCTLGTIGVLTTGQVAVDILLSELSKAAATHPRYHPLPKTAAIVEDLTFTLPEHTALGPILNLIKNTASSVTNISVVSQYEQNFTLRLTYWEETHTLSNEEIEPIRRQIVATVEQLFRAQLVGQV